MGTRGRKQCGRGPRAPSAAQVVAATHPHDPWRWVFDATGHSVTSRLLVGVLGAVALVWLATAVVSYRDAHREIDALLDAHLSQAATLLVAQAVHEVEEIETEHSPAVTPYGQKVAFQVWEHGRRLRVHSVDA